MITSGAIQKGEPTVDCKCLLPLKHNKGNNMCESVTKHEWEQQKQLTTSQLKQNMHPNNTIMSLLM